MSSAVNIITTCTDRKTQPVSRKLQLRFVKSSNVQDKFGQWKTRLIEVLGNGIRAEYLYGGEHWSVARSMVDAAKLGNHIGDLWITSAGYGLIRPDTKISPYAATFSSLHKDAVTAGIPKNEQVKAVRQWWKRLGRWKGPARSMPRSVEQIANEMPNAPILVIGSEAYIRAMYDDLIAARIAINDPEKLIIVSAGAKRLEDLEMNVVPCDARLQSVVNGSRMALNARMGRKILGEAKRWPLHVAPLRERYVRLLERQPAIQTYNRRTMSDDEVNKYIRRSLSHDSDLAATRSLRELRDSGHACEQKRFGQLFRKVKEEIHGA